MMKQNPNHDTLTQLRAKYAEKGLELSEDLNTIRITDRFQPGEWNDLTDEEMEGMTPEEVERERTQRREGSWMPFLSRLRHWIMKAQLHEAVYLSNPGDPDVEYRDFSDFTEAYLVQCRESGARFGESEWDGTMGVRLVSRFPKEVIVDEDHPCLSVRDGVLFNKDQTELIWYPCGREGETYTIPDGVTKIGKWAFAGYWTTVAKRRPDGSRVDRLWQRVFSNVIDGGTDAEYQTESGSVGRWVFNRNLRHVIMPDTVTVIWDHAFDHCLFLNSVKLSFTLAEIRSAAFSGCEEMREINLPDSLERLMADQCAPLMSKKHFFHDNLERVNFLGVRCRLQHVITSRGERKFRTEPYTPEFFSEVFKSKKDVMITFEAGNERFSSEDGVIFNKDRTELIYCPRWKSGVYIVPETVVRIGKKAFENCCGLTRIIFAGCAVTDVGDGAFADCSSLQDIDLHSVKYIGYGAFQGCGALTHIDLGSGTSV